MLRTPIALALIAILSLAVGCGSDDGPTGSNTAATPTLKFSAIPGEKATKLKAKFDQFAAHLADKLGVKCEYVGSSSYGASVAMFEKGEIHFAWFGGLTGVLAREKVAGATAFGQGTEDPNYFSYFIANKDSGIEKSDSPDKLPKGLEGKSFGFGSEKSTSGRLMPEHFIRTLSGKSPKEFFGSEPQFLKKHPLTAKGVEAGTVQAGALSYKTYDKMVAEGKLDPEVCRVVWKTPYYADYNFTMRPELDKAFGEGFSKKLTDTILAYADKDVLENGFQRSGFIPAKNEDFNQIRELAAKLGFLD